MLDVYANWIEGADAREIARMEQAMRRSPAIRHHVAPAPSGSTQAIEKDHRKYVAEREGFEPSKGF